ncbi:MAG: hypothetical protein ABI806_13785 [Candidatus Solibacter sp.]
MKRLALLFSCSAALVCAADLPGVHTVYVLKMAHGLDQHLASALTTGHVFQIVTDPKLADAVFTDQIGEGLQLQLEEISPTPEDPKVAAEKEKKKKEEPPPTDDVSLFMGDTVNKLDNPALKSTFGRSRGTVFLVDTKSRQVVWSVYQQPKGGGSKDMDRTATDIVSRLKKDLKGK